MTTTIEAPREALPEPLKVVAWTYTHKISEAGCVSIWRWPIGHPARELHDEEELVRLTDAQSALESERQAHAAEVERLRGDAERPTNAVLVPADKLRELREDSARYAWLIHKFGETRIPCMLEPVLEDYVADGKESIDAAIDQAIARGKK